MSAVPVWIERRSALTPDALALVAGEDRLPWSALAARARSLAAALHEEGARPGDTAAGLLETGVTQVALFHAAMICGVTWMPVNTRWTAREMTGPLRRSGARWLLHGGGDLETRAREAAGDAPGVTLLDARALDEAAAAPRPAGEGGRGEARVALEACATLVHTSGTSEEPRGVELTAANWLWSATASAMHLGAVPGDRWLLCVPLFHVAGLSILARAVLFGAAVVIHERFAPGRILETLESERVTLVSLVPTMLARLLEAAGSRRSPASLRCVLLGGGPIPEALLQEAWARGWPVAPTYGLTETTAQVATLPLPEIGRRSGARPLLPTEVRIVDERGNACAANEPGEIQVRGPTVMAGYRGRPEETARALGGDGWLRTGDVGSVDREGFLHVLDRRTDLIVTGGENVAPSEVEAVLRLHPDVLDAGVVATPDAELGQRVCAFVVVRPGRRLEPRELQAFCREHLAGYKIPRLVRRVDALPRTASGKLLRRLLRDPSQAGSMGA